MSSGLCIFILLMSWYFYDQVFSFVGDLIGICNCLLLALLLCRLSQVSLSWPVNHPLSIISVLHFCIPNCMLMSRLTYSVIFISC